MSNHVEWIAAQAELDPPKPLLGNALQVQEARRAKTETILAIRPENLPAHNFKSWVDSKEEWQEDDPLDRNPYIGQYRERTVALLRRYVRAALETGRMPSIVGKEFFRAKVTAYRSVTFEDRVIFVSDVEKILGGLEYWDQQLIARLILQEHSHEKAARLLGCDRKTIGRRLPEVVDLLSEKFLEVGLLVAVSSSGKNRREEKSCQEAKSTESLQAIEDKTKIKF
jgi:hypothetical protein